MKRNPRKTGCRVRILGHRSDGEPASNGYLGEFRRGPVLFVVYAIPLDQGRYPSCPAHFLIDCFDPIGPGEVCRFTDDPTDTPPRGRSYRWGRPAPLLTASRLTAVISSRFVAVALEPFLALAR